MGVVEIPRPGAAKWTARNGRNLDRSAVGARNTTCPRDFAGGDDLSLPMRMGPRTRAYRASWEPRLAREDAQEVPLAAELAGRAQTPRRRADRGVRCGQKKTP